MWTPAPLRFGSCAISRNSLDRPSGGLHRWRRLLQSLVGWDDAEDISFVLLVCPVLDSRTAGYDLLNGTVLGEDKRLAIDMAARQYKRMELRDWFVGCLVKRWSQIPKSPEMASWWMCSRHLRGHWRTPMRPRSFAMTLPLERELDLSSQAWTHHSLQQAWAPKEDCNLSWSFQDLGRHRYHASTLRASTRHTRKGCIRSANHHQPSPARSPNAHTWPWSQCGRGPQAASTPPRRQGHLHQPTVEPRKRQMTRSASVSSLGQHDHHARSRPCCVHTGC